MRCVDPMCINGRGGMSKGRIWFLLRGLKIRSRNHSNIQASGSTVCWLGLGLGWWLCMSHEVCEWGLVRMFDAWQWLCGLGVPGVSRARAGMQMQPTFYCNQTHPGVFFFFFSELTLTVGF